MPSILLVYVLIGDNVSSLDECITYYYFDLDRTPRLLKRFLDKCDGTCSDRCTDKQRRRVDAMFEFVESGIDEGWAVKQSNAMHTTIPIGLEPIERVITVTAIP